MANMFDGNKSDLFANVKQDQSMDLGTLIRTQKATTDGTNVQPTPTTTPQSKTTINEHLSPLESALKKQDSLGMNITREQYEAGLERTTFKSAAENDERINAINGAQDEIDMMLKRRAAVIPLKQYETDAEFVQMMHEISLVNFDASTGKAYIDYEKDDNGEIIPLTMIRLRTDNDLPFSKENDQKQIRVDAINRQRVANGQEPIQNTADIDTTSVADETNDGISDDKKKVVQFIIDKTGLGVDFALTDDERNKLVEANEIRLTQVEVIDIASIKTVKPDRDSFTGKIHEYTLSGSKTTISFPGSGFKADMTGLTYGEIGDISLSMDSVNVDKYYKRLAIIYNKMKNISSGPFKSFEDFLKNIAYTDIPLAVYGLYVSTFPEIQSISLRCGSAECNKTFDWNFNTRGVLQLQKSDDVFLDHLKELAGADPDQYDEIYKRAAVRNVKVIRLPKCGFLVEMGIASAWEFLYNFLPLLDEKTFNDAFGEDINQVYMNNILLLTTVLSVYVPDPARPGTYIHCQGYKDILDAIYNINPDDFKYMASISQKIQREYQAYFSFGDVVCPHCQNVTHDLELTIDDLVFQTYQRLISTEVDLTNIQGL